MKGSILVIDDDKPILEAIQTILDDFGLSVSVADNAGDGERMAMEADYDLILLDIRMPDKNGADVTKAIIARKPAARIFVITGYPGDQLTQDALANGAKGILKKPFEIAKILDFFATREKDVSH